MLDEAVGPILESLRLGRTDILRTLLEEVRVEMERQEKAGGGQGAGPRFRAFLDAPRAKGRSFLHEAAACHNGDGLRTLLHLGADPSLAGEDGIGLAERCGGGGGELGSVLVSSAVAAVVGSDSTMVERLLRGGVDANASEAGGRSLLHWASTCADAATAEALLAAGADPNVRDSSGATPMHEALLRREEDVAAALVRAGADIHIQAIEGTFAGQSPLNMIRTCSDHHWSSDFLGLLTIPNGVSNGVESSKKARKVTPISSSDENMTTEKDKELINSSPGKNSPAKDKEDMDSLQRDSLLLRASSPLAPVITDERLDFLWPRPAVVRQLQAEPIVFPPDLQVTVAPSAEYPVHKIMEIFELNRHLLRSAGRRLTLNDSAPVGDRAGGANGAPSSAAVVCVSVAGGGARGAGGVPAAVGAYTLHVAKLTRRGERRIKLCAGDLEGLQHAVVTLAQLFRLFRSDDGLLPVYLSDRPQCSVRALLLDMNPYGRVPKFDVIGQLVDVMSSLKMNQLQVFFRLSKGGGWGFSHSKCHLLSVDRFCRDRFVDLVPAFDVDAGVTRSDLVELLPTIREIQSCVSQTKYVHIGPVLTSLLFKHEDSDDAPPLDVATSAGRQVDYADLLFPKAEVLLVCGNSLVASGGSRRGGMSESENSTGGGDDVVDLPELPLKAVALFYGFHQSFGFMESLGQLLDSGLSVGVCTGTGAWNNLAGSPDSMMASQLAATRAMSKLGAPGSGVSVTAHFSSDPALAHSLFAWPGLVAAAGLSWNSSFDLDHLRNLMGDLIDLHVMSDQDFSWGGSILELGRAEQQLEPASSVRGNGESTHLLRLLISPKTTQIKKLHLNKLNGSIQMVRRVLSSLQRASPTTTTSTARANGGDGDQQQRVVVDQRMEEFRHELHLTAELLLLSARLAKALLGIPSSSSSEEGQDSVLMALEELSPTFKTDFANKLLALREQFRALWLTRYQPQGMQGSLAAMNALLAKFISQQQAEILHE